MSRVAPPNGYSSWNDYIDAQVAALVNPTPEQIKLLKRDIKLGMIAQPERSDPNTNSYREYNTYSSPGTVSPTVGHPLTKP